MNELLTKTNNISILLESVLLESKDLYKKEKTPVKLLSKLKKVKKLLKLDDEIQAILIAILYDYKLNDDYLTNKDISIHLGCKISELTVIINRINKLFFKGLIIKIDNQSRKYIELETNFFTYIINDELESYYKTLNVVGINDFFLHVNITANYIITISNESSIVSKEEYYEMYIALFNSSLKVNRNVTIIKKLNNIDFPNDYAKFILYYLVYCMVFQNMKEFNVGNLINTMFPLGGMLSDLKDFFTSKNSILSNLGLVEPIKGDYNAGSIRFTEKFTSLYLKDDKDLVKFLPEPYIENSSIIKAVNIKKKNLYYNTLEKKQIDIITKALDKDNYSDLMDRLNKAGFSKGLTMLFHGFPGTGKTETALQLSKITGRSVMHVDFSQIKDMYVGNSEKNLKALFKSYYSYIEKTNDIPILLFNEADSVISKRISNIKGSTDQMNNTLQNILLEEMEDFKGIMIATTNLIDNIDSAFDRRFLYKIKFNKPNSVNRQKMWNNRNKWLNKKDAKSIANKFEFTGGQIENVTKKYLIDSALKGESEDVKVLEEYCKEEEFRNISDSEKEIFNGF